MMMTDADVNALNGIMYKITEIRSKLLMCFYTDPEIMQSLISTILANNSYISSYSQNGASLQFQVRKSFLKRFDDPSDSLQFYNVFNASMSNLFDTYMDYIICNILDGDVALFDFMKANIQQFYNLVRVSANTVIIYL